MPDATRLKIPFNLPSIEEAEVEEVIAALRSAWLTTGPRTARFESALKEYLGCRHVVAVSSCTAAMHLALKSMRLEPGDEVITTPLTFVATVFAISQAGGVPVLADIEEETMNLDVNEVKKKITAKTKGILPVHYGGHPCAMREIHDLAQHHGLFVIEDAAHAIGAAYKEKRIGSLGSKATCFSFYANKNLSMGEGGALATDDEALADEARIMALHGMSRDAWRRYDEKGTWAYDVLAEGYKYNMTDIQAAIGVHQLARLDVMNDRRRYLVSLYQEAFASLDNVQLPVEKEGCYSAWHLYPLRLKMSTAHHPVRNHLIEYLKSCGIGTSVHFIPVFHFMHFQGRKGFDPGSFPVTERVFWQELSLPLYPSMTDEDVHYVAAQVKKGLQKYAR